METRTISFNNVVGGKLAAILPASGRDGMRRVVIADPGFMPKKGVVHNISIWPVHKKFGEPVVLIHEGERLHIHSYQLLEEANILEKIEQMCSIGMSTGNSTMAKALLAAKIRSGKEIPFVGQLEIGQRINLKVSNGIDTRTGYLAFEVEYFDYGDPLIGGEKSMRICHVSGENPGLISGQTWMCKVISIRPSETKNKKGHRIIHIWVFPQRVVIQ